MITKLIGFGAAGNKSAICAVNLEILPIEDVLLINSTSKDIPSEYQNREGALCYTYKNAYGGCGKERSASFELCEETLKNDFMDLKSFLKIGTPDEAELVIISTATEGGTGSGGAPLLADFIRRVYGISVHIFAFAGFEDDVRGLRNTVDFFKDMKPNFTVQCIKNSKFLSECNGNKIKAEQAANKEFCKKISILMGLQLRDSDHNIDPTDLLKLSTEEGYMIIEQYTFSEKIKNADQFRSAVITMCDNSKALDIDDPSQKKMGIIINIKKENTDYIDYSILFDRYGIPYEKFEHIQHEDDMPEFIAFISSGMKMPLEEVENTYNKYKMIGQKVDRSSDNFFQTIRGKEIDPNDNQFDLAKTKDTISADDFFSSNKKPINGKSSMTISDPKNEY